MAIFTEIQLEQQAIELLEKHGWQHIAPEALRNEREGRDKVLLVDRLQQAIDKLNPDLPQQVRDTAVRKIGELTAQDIEGANDAFYQMLTEGVGDDYQQDGETIGAKVAIIDFANPSENDLAVCSQFSVYENNKTKRADLVLFINGMPLVVIELKNPVDEQATLESAYHQLQNYKQSAPSLFCYNAALVVSDGRHARVGSLTAEWSRFTAWRTVDGVREDDESVQINTVIEGMLRADVLLELVRHFSVFENTRQLDDSRQTIARKVKKIAAYHQYHAVKKAVESTIRASQSGHEGWMQDHPAQYNLPNVDQQPSGDRKAGVMWHTQGSGKSLSMLFYAGLLIASEEMRNPTIVVVTDRVELDKQLFEAFVAGKRLLRQEPQPAKNRAHLKTLLKTVGGGVVFTTLQKFMPEDNQTEFETLSERNNIVVIADEAHRSQYGFGARMQTEGDEVRTRYGFAKYMRDALPEASFIGFTGTPIEKEDASTPAVFGNYIDIYDMQQAIADRVAVPIFYESRLVKLHLSEQQGEKLDRIVEKMGGDENNLSQREKANWTRQEALIGNSRRVQSVAEDIVMHYEARRQASVGKAMIVTASRRIAVAMYDAIIAQRRQWHDDDCTEGAIKVVMTSSSSDPPQWQAHATDNTQKTLIRQRFIAPDDSLRMIIVCDMWLTGFDAPCLDTMYLDKIMSGHTLMQAIARVNRVHRDKSGGLIVDYIGIGASLQKALNDYTNNSGGREPQAFKQEEAVAKMLELYEVVGGIFGEFNYRDYFKTPLDQRLKFLCDAQEHILDQTEGKRRFVQNVTALSKSFALSVPDSRALDIKDEVGLFESIKALLNKLEPHDGERNDIEMESVIRQAVDDAVTVGGIVDVFGKAGLLKPRIEVLSDEFLEDVRQMPKKNLALELLKKLLKDEIGARSRTNIVQSRKFSEMLQDAIRRYTENVINAAELMEELIAIAKEYKTNNTRAEQWKMSDAEIAFYDALANNPSAREAMRDESLRALAKMLLTRVHTNATIDWTFREGARAKLRVLIRELLDEYGYPPDKQKEAVKLVMEQAELLAERRARGVGVE